MKSVLAIHQKLHRWQQKSWSRVLLTLLFSASIITLLTLTLVSSYRLYELRSEIFNLLTGSEQRIAALQLEETGFIELDGIAFGDERLKGFRYLDEDGIVINPAGATTDVLRNEVPTNIPIWLLQEPNITWLVGGIILVFCTFTIWLGLFLPLSYSSVVAFIGWTFCQWVNAPNAAMAKIGRAHV